MKTKKYAKWSYIGIILGMIMCVSFLILTYKSCKLVVSGVRTIGIVTDIKIDDNTEDGTAYSISAKYDCGSKKGIEGNSMWSSNTYHYDIGEKITLYCSEDDPRKFLPKNFLNYMLFLFPFFSILGILGIISRIVNEVKRKRLQQELTQFGKKVEAIVVDIMFDGNNDNINSYRIKAKYLDNEFISERIVVNAKMMWKVGDKIDVYLDYEDNSRYWMDTESVFEKSVDNTTVIG